MLDRQDVTLALENNEAFSAAEFAMLIRRIASPRVGICLDTANSLGRPETLETVVEQLAEHAVVLHAKDYDIHRVDTRMGFSVTGTPAGEGRVNFDWVLTELCRHGRTRNQRHRRALAAVCREHRGNRSDRRGVARHQCPIPAIEVAGLC